jgi:hypothetical protein
MYVPVFVRTVFCDMEAPISDLWMRIVFGGLGPDDDDDNDNGECIYIHIYVYIYIYIYI